MIMNIEIRTIVRIRPQLANGMTGNPASYNTTSVSLIVMPPTTAVAMFSKDPLLISSAMME
jgi:hypothetical protein